MTYCTGSSSRDLITGEGRLGGGQRSTGRDGVGIHSGAAHQGHGGLTPHPNMPQNDCVGLMTPTPTSHHTHVQDRLTLGKGVGTDSCRVSTELSVGRETG